MSETGRLAGRRVFITGAGSGIGKAAAERVVADGGRVALFDVRGSLAEEAAAALGLDVAVPLTGDVGDESDVRAAVAAAAQAFGGLDGVVANAGVVTIGAVHELTLADWERVIRTNLTGVFLTLREVLPHLMDAGGGSIVTIGSISSVVVGSGLSAASYKASKGGVLQLTRDVAVEYAHVGIRANCVCPGQVATSVATHMREEHVAWTTARTFELQPVVTEAPMRRPADPSEVASVVAFLLSDDASFMTGSAVMVDGGYTAI